MKIGDIVPPPPDWDVDRARRAIRSRGYLARNAGREDVGNSSLRAAVKIMNGLAENSRRAADPVERAKRHLRQLGYIPVYQDGPTFVAGRRRFPSMADFLAFATEKGWTP